MEMTILQQCYEYQVIQTDKLDENLVVDMALALSVSVVFTPEDPSWADEDDPMNMTLRLYKVNGSSLQMAIGFDGNTKCAYGRLVTPAYLKYVKEVHAVHIEAEYFDIMRTEAYFGELLGVFPMQLWDEPYFNQ